MRLAIVVCASLLGCLRADLVPCGDRLCAGSQVCVVDRCLDPSLVDQCAMPVVEGAACDALGAAGRCLDGVCETATCGDGYVDTSLREDCDDTLPAAQCVDFGFDLGRPGCTACQADLRAGCLTFGWRLALNAPAEVLWTDGETFAYYRYEPPSLEVHTPTADTSLPGFVYEIDGGGGRVAARGDFGFVDALGGAAIATPFAIEDLETFEITDDGTLVAMVNCQLFTQPAGGSWQPGAKVSDVTSCSRLEVSLGRTFVIANGTRVFELVGGSFVERFSVTGQIHDVMYSAVPVGPTLYLAFTGGVATSNGSLPPKLLPLDLEATTLAVAGGHLYAALADGTIARWDGEFLGRIASPGTLAITSDGEHVYGYRGPIYRYEGTDFSARIAIPQHALQELPVGVIERVGKQPIVVTSYQLLTPDSFGLDWSVEDSIAIQPMPIRAASGIETLFAYTSYLAPPEANRRQSLWLRPSGLEGPSALPVDVPTDPFLHGVWVAGDRSVFVGGDDDATPPTGFLGRRSDAGEWTIEHVPGCTFRGVHGTAPDDVIAVGGCTGAPVIWHFDGTAWRELARPTELGAAAFLGVRAFAGGRLVATGGGGTATFDGATWTFDPFAIGSVLSGTPDDLWLSGSFTNVQHYDGTTWAQMTTRSVSSIHVVAQGKRILLPGGAAGFAELLR